MIVEFTYDSGDPYYMSIVDRWTEPREPVWRFKCKSANKDWYTSLVDWLENNCGSGYDYTYRFNDGDPYLSVELLDLEDVIAFRLRFE
jgi:hypothetical protein